MTKLAPQALRRTDDGRLVHVDRRSATSIAGLVGGNVDPEKLAEMPLLFQRTAISLFVAAALLLLLVVPIRRMLARTAR